MIVEFFTKFNEILKELNVKIMGSYEEIDAFDKAKESEKSL